MNDLSLALAGHVGEKMRYKQERNDLINKEADAKKSRQKKMNGGPRHEEWFPVCDVEQWNATRETRHAALVYYEIGNAKGCGIPGKCT